MNQIAPKMSSEGLLLYYQLKKANREECRFKLIVHYIEALFYMSINIMLFLFKPMHKSMNLLFKYHLLSNWVRWSSGVETGNWNWRSLVRSLTKAQFYYFFSSFFQLCQRLRDFGDLPLQYIAMIRAYLDTI
jgi:hypothetical protein